MWGWLPTIDGEWVILGLGGSGTTPPRRRPPADEDDPRPCLGGVERTKEWELVGGAGLRRRGNKAVGIGGVSWFRRTAAKRVFSSSNLEFGVIVARSFLFGN